MIRLLHAHMEVLTSALERFATRLSEDAKSYPRREYYRGYRQGVSDGLAGLEHAKKWLLEKEGK